MKSRRVNSLSWLPRNNNGNGNDTEAEAETDDVVVVEAEAADMIVVGVPCEAIHVFVVAVEVVLGTTLEVPHEVWNIFHHYLVRLPCWLGMALPLHQELLLPLSVSSRHNLFDNVACRSVSN